MPKISMQSTVKIHNMKYYYTSIPKSIAEDLLGLKHDVEKQRLKWKINKGQVCVEAENNGCL
ncbi:MAG: hypothetical protein ABIH20_01170 [Candidatus Diapherotrites archaeon]